MTPQDDILQIKGVGPKIASIFKTIGIETIKDLLLFLPIRYETNTYVPSFLEFNDQDITTTIAFLKNKTYIRKRMHIVLATFEDREGNQKKAIWFNNPYILKRLFKNKLYFITGKLNKDKIVQPTIVLTKTFSTNFYQKKIIPIYSSKLKISRSTITKIIKNLKQQIDINTLEDELTTLDSSIQNIYEALFNLHLPIDLENIKKAKKRLALEEMLSIIYKSRKLKNKWAQRKTIGSIKQINLQFLQKLPFKLTNAQQKAINDILDDLKKDTPMNRLLIGDVGSGKTIVAATALKQIYDNDFDACLIAPTRILAIQHFERLKNMFPATEIVLVTNKTKFKKINHKAIYIGTHALIPKIETINPALIVFDEQHRFGVSQRSTSFLLEKQPHILTMSATPIPRTIMLSIFQHLDVSYIDEMPKGRIPVNTSFAKNKQRQKIYDFIYEYIYKNFDKKPLVLFVCPFIEKSENERLSYVKNVEEVFSDLSKQTKKYEKKYKINIQIEKLHSKLKEKQKQDIFNKLFEKKINILITTPMIEVGLDLDNANIIVIESAEKFGLASLHQLRGRVGRNKEQAYCFVFASQTKQENNQRLKFFEQENSGLKLAEFDLKNRGPGDIFGLEQHGITKLQFANWSDLELIKQAHEIYKNYENTKKQYLFKNKFEIKNVLAN